MTQFIYSPFVRVAAFQVLFLSLSISAKAQNFEWAASATGIQLGYSYVSVDPYDNIIVGGEAYYLSPVDIDNVRIFDAHGKGVDINYSFWVENIVLSFSPTGDVNWHLQFNYEYSKLEGIAHLGDTTVLLVHINLLDEDEHGRPYGYIPELLGDSSAGAGLTLLYLDEKGKLVKHQQIFKQGHENIDITGFQSHPSGGFVLTGFVSSGVIFLEPETDVGSGGGDLLLKLDDAGNVDWVNVVTYLSETCCGNYGRLSAAVAGDGTIYMGGTYLYGGSFGDELQIKSPKMPNQDRFRNKPFETYVASYSSKGEINWVQTSVSRSKFHALAAVDKGVYIGFELHEADSAFGQKIDTTQSKTICYAAFSNKGTLNWVQSSPAGDTYNMATDPEGNLYVLGESEQRYHLLPACFNKEGKSQWRKDTRISVDNLQPVNLAFDSKQDIYIACTLHYGLPTRLPEKNDAFKAGEAYGMAPMIAKFK